MKLVRYMISNQHVITDKVYLDILGEEGSCYVTTDRDTLYLIEKGSIGRLVDRDIKGNKYIYLIENIDVPDDKHEKFFEFYDKVTESLKHQLDLINAGIDSIKFYEEKIKEHKRVISEANTYTLACMSTLASVSKDLKEGPSNGKSDNRETL